MEYKARIVKCIVSFQNEIPMKNLRARTHKYTIISETYDNKGKTLINKQILKTVFINGNV